MYPSRLLLYHTHTLKRPSSYFLEPPPLPPEDLEPPPEKHEVDAPRDAEMPAAKHHDSNKKSNSKKGRRRPNPRLTPTGTANYMPVSTDSCCRMLKIYTLLKKSSLYFISSTTSCQLSLKS